MKTAWLSIFSLLVIASISGCNSPRLAETPYSQTEMQWEEYLKDSYPEWEPPQTLPPTEDVAGAKTDDKGQAPVFVLEEDTVAVVEPVAETPAAKCEMYTVEKGDSLWKISKKFYKRGTEWKRILDANKDVLPTPDKIKPGMQLRIPAL
jgi:LysM repeat protein